MASDTDPPQMNESSPATGTTPGSSVPNHAATGTTPPLPFLAQIYARPLNRLLLAGSAVYLLVFTPYCASFMPTVVAEPHFWECLWLLACSIAVIVFFELFVLSVAVEAEAVVSDVRKRYRKGKYLV